MTACAGRNRKQDRRDDHQLHQTHGVGAAAGAGKGAGPGQIQPQPEAAKAGGSPSRENDREGACPKRQRDAEHRSQRRYHQRFQPCCPEVRHRLCPLQGQGRE